MLTNLAIEKLNAGPLTHESVPFTGYIASPAPPPADGLAGLIFPLKKPGQ